MGKSQNKLMSLGLDSLDCIITDELGGIQFRKPCDVAFRIMTTRWKLSPVEVVCVGDNPAKDFQAPQQLGIKTVYFKNSDGLYKDKVTGRKAIRSIKELREII